MKRLQLLFLSLAALIGLSSAASGQSSSPLPTDEEIRKILIGRLGNEASRIGIVVGVIDPAGRRILSHGSFGENDPRPVDGNTVFEIGSTTKVFTSLLLADMAQRSEVALTDPAAKYLPPGVKMPERNGRAITLEDLARHRSGLPRLPANLDASKNPSNPYATYSVNQLYEFLSSYQLPRDIGAEFEYSNLGMGLLGHILSLAAGKDYETLIRTRICAPLGMGSTAINLSPEMKSRLAAGHNDQFKPTPNWDIPTLAGAGALRSTANDMLSFLAAQLGYKESALTPAIKTTLARRTSSNPGMEIGLGWIVRPKTDSEIVWHNGGTGGYRTFAGFDPKARTGVVVLSNVSTAGGVDDIGFHLLDAASQLLPHDSPLVAPPKEHKEITLDSDTLELYVGTYQFVPNVFVTITREGTQLSAQLTGQPPYPIYPESKTGFFLKVTEAQILFKTDDQGRPNGLVLRQLGREQFARRVEGNSENLQEWFGHREKQIDPALLDHYAGRYQFPNGPLFTVTREGDRLFTQQEGQPKLEVFAESERVFFSKLMDGQITFEGEAAGPASALVLRQNGQERRAARVPE